MPTADQTINRILFDKAQELHDKPRTIVPFTNIPESDALLNNIETYPHFFVLGCIMDRQIPAERAWNIPTIISKECGGPQFEKFLSLDLPELASIFSDKRLHRFNEQMAKNFHSAIQIIHAEYQDNAANIWLGGQPGSKVVIDRFERFPGVGQKISTMATNILVREFKVPLKDVHEIDISVDSQIEKVFKRMGMVSANASKQEIIEAARGIYPEYPGIADSVVWEIGREWCKTDLSACRKCYLNDYCPKNPVGIAQDPNPGGNRPSKTLSGTEVSTNTRPITIKPGKYRPRFEELIRLSRENVPRNCRIILSSSRTNAKIIAQGHPHGVLYEFDDWNDRISIEIQVNRSVTPQAQPVLIAISERELSDLPTPKVTDQGVWTRLQFFFDEDVPLQILAESMSRLVDQTYDEIRTISPTG